jgi:hypothetical protein
MQEYEAVKDGEIWAVRNKQTLKIWKFCLTENDAQMELEFLKVMLG